MDKAIIRPIALAAALSALAGGAAAQGTKADYQRAEELKQKYASQNILNNNVSPVWIGDKGDFWYDVETSAGKVFKIFDSKSKKIKSLSDTTGQNLPKRSGYNYWAEQEKNSELDRYWSDTPDYKQVDTVYSADGNLMATVEGINLSIKETKTGKTIYKTSDASPECFYTTFGLQFSPDGKKVAALKIADVEKQYIYYVESCPRNQFQPRLHKQEYQKPGCPLPQKFPQVINLESGKQFQCASETIESQYDIDFLTWNHDSRYITFEYNRRGHQLYSLIKLDAENGKQETIVEEKSDKYINWTRIYREHIFGTETLLWTSERDNYNHIYLVDKLSKQIRQVTKGEFYVRGIQHVDPKAKRIYFSANGVDKDIDPYFVKYYSIGFDGKGMRCLTPENQMHKASFSPNSEYLVDVFSTISNPQTAVLRDKNGKLIAKLEEADASKLYANGFRAPEVFVAKGRDNQTDMWGLIYRPTNFDPKKKYPIVEYIYSGPGDQYVCKTFRPYDWDMTGLAELGFVVVMVDGMTTSFRSKAFEEVCYKNLKDAGYPDHKAWIKAACEKYPQLDSTRIGIFGCSAGGQESLSNLLLHPDFYKCAYSACGCHDNRMDKIWWNEQWLSYPLDKSYLEGSNIENAHLLKRPLMLVWGELDDNVDPASSMKVVNALIKANKNFEMICIPGAHHTMGENYGEHKRYDFFVKHLQGIEPPEWD